MLRTGQGWSGLVMLLVAATLGTEMAPPAGRAGIPRNVYLVL